MEHWEETERLLRDALLQIDCIPPEDRKNITEFLNHNELGLAFESIVDTFSEENLKLTTEVFSLVQRAARNMGYDGENSPAPERWAAFLELGV